MFDFGAIYLVDGPLDLKLPQYALAHADDAGGFMLVGPGGSEVPFQLASVPEPVGPSIERWVAIQTTAGALRLKRLRDGDDEVAQIGMSIEAMVLVCSS